MTFYELLEGKQYLSTSTAIGYIAIFDEKSGKLLSQLYYILPITSQHYLEVCKAKLQLHENV